LRVFAQNAQVGFKRLLKMTGNLQNQQKFTKVSRNDAEIIGFDRCFSGVLA